MRIKVNLNGIYRPSDDVVVRDIQGELIIVPLVAGVGDSDEEIFTLNETGRSVWSRLNGKRTLKEIVNALRQEYDVSQKEIEEDVIGIVKELVVRKMLVAVR